MKTSLINDVRHVLTLLAGFAFGMHLAVLLHELGHALGHWVGGGHVTAFVMQSPLPAGYVRGPAPNPYLAVWGGVVFGSLCTLVFLALAHWLRGRSVLRFVALMTAAFCLGHNGLYLFVGGIVPYADAEGMIQLGAPPWLLFLSGIPMLIGFTFVLTVAILHVGLRPTEPLWRWIVVVEAGLLTVPAVMLAGLAFGASSRSMLAPMALLVSSYAVCFGVAAYRARSVARWSAAHFESVLMPQRWLITFALLGGAALLMALEWLMFRPG